MTSTWTQNDVTRIKNSFNLSYEYVTTIEYLLTTFETQYGASAITELQSKLTAIVALKVAIDAKKASASYGVIQESVTGFYSQTRTQGTEIQALQYNYDSLRQWVIRELHMQSIIQINTSRVIRA